MWKPANSIQIGYVGLQKTGRIFIASALLSLLHLLFLTNSKMKINAL